MPIRAYVLYSAAAAAAALTNVQILKPCEIVGVLFAQYAAVGNGSADELSLSAARQYGASGTQGILAVATHSVAAAATSPLASNTFVPFAPGCKLNTGDIVYLHGTQQGAGGTITRQVTLYVRE